MNPETELWRLRYERLQEWLEMRLAGSREMLNGNLSDLRRGSVRLTEALMGDAARAAMNIARFDLERLRREDSKPQPGP